MGNGPTRVCVFNVKANQQPAPPIVPNQTGSNLIDIVTACDGVTVPSLGAASYGVPVVLNPNGVIDSSLLNTGATATAGVNLQLGAPLVHLYSVGGVLTAEYADAGGGSPPTPSLSAQGFLTSPIDAGHPGTIAFSGLFTYIDPNSEFSLSSVGQEVYLSSVTPGGITLTRPSSPSLDQTVGYVVAFTAPNVVTAIFLAGFNDFSRISGCLATTQLCSVQGTGAFVQLTVGAPPPSPVNTHLGTAANYAILAYSGITNASPATSVTGGVIGTQTATITGFNPPTATVDNANAAAARVAGQAAFTYFSGLTPTQTGLANLSNNNGGGGLGIYHAGVFSGGALDIPTTITLDAQGNPNALFVFISASTTVLHSGASILLVNGAQAANVVWVVGSSFTSTATSTMVGNILAYTSITLGGGILSGRALAVGGGNGAVTIPAATAITVPAGAGGTITAGDIVTFDTFGNTLDSGISLEGVLSSIFVNPMTTNGDMIYEGLTVGSPPVLGPLRLPIGTTGQVLTVVGGIPAWQTPVLPQTFTPTPAGSPPEFEYLTGYSASTGLFSAAPLPPSGTSVSQTVRLNIGTVNQGNPVTGPWTVNFTTPFADGNYTVQCSVTCGEAPGTPTIAASPALLITCINYQATPGNGVIVWIENNDSIPHTNVTINVTAIHD